MATVEVNDAEQSTPVLKTDTASVDHANNNVDEVVRELEVENKYTIISDNMELCEICHCLIDDAMVIFYTPNLEFTIKNIKPTLVVIALCELDSTVLAAAKAMSREIRILRQTADSAAMGVPSTLDDAPQTIINNQENVNDHTMTFFAPEDFLDNVPIDPDMFSQYMADKMLPLFYSQYKPKFYMVTSADAQYFRDGAKYQGMSLGEAINSLKDAGNKCFECEAEFSIIGKMCKTMSMRNIMSQLNAGRDVRLNTSICVDSMYTDRVYKLIMGELPPYDKLYENVLAATYLSHEGMQLRSYHKIELLEEFVTTTSNNTYSYILPYDKITKYLLL